MEEERKIRILAAFQSALSAPWYPWGREQTHKTLSPVS